MARTLVAYFDSVYSAEKAIHDLAKNEFSRDRISIRLSHNGSKEAQTDPSGPLVAPEPEIIFESLGAGIRAGAVIGSALALAGALLLSLGVLDVPGYRLQSFPGLLNALLNLGIWLAAGTISGVVIGSLIGMVLNLHIPESEVRQYARTVRQGKVAVSLLADYDEVDGAIQILNRHAPLEVKQERVTRQVAEQSLHRPARLSLFSKPRWR